MSRTRLAAFAAALLFLAPAALAQTSPGWVTGQVPTAAQWNAEWASKADATNGSLSNATINLGTITGAAISGGSITNTPISGSTGAFTTLSASGLTTIGANSYEQEVNGELWITTNAVWNSTTSQWNRVNTAQYAFALQMGPNNLLSEGTPGVASWICAPGANPISSTFGAVGGWQINWVSVYRNFVVGGQGIELDGSGTVNSSGQNLFGRFVQNGSGTAINTGIVSNIFDDYSGTDAAASPSWFVGFVGDQFAVKRAPAGSTTLTPMISVDAYGDLAVAGNAVVTGSLSASGPLTANAVFPITNPGTGVDATANINSAIALAVAAGGGTVLSPPTTLTVNGAIEIPYTGSTNPIQVPIRFSCNGSVSPWPYLGNSQSGSPTPANSCAWDMRYNGTDGLHPAKIDTRGAGLLEIEHLTIEDGGTDNFLFLQTTNTTLNLHDMRFSGNLNCLRTTCLQNAIQLGGITSASSTLNTDVATDGFQGYGTQLRNIFFDHIKVAVGFGGSANGVHVENLTTDITCGSSDTLGAPYVFYGVGLGTGGNVISTGIVEMRGYPYAVSMIGTVNNLNNVISYLGAYDEAMGSPSVAFAYFSATSINNAIYVGQTDSSLLSPIAAQPGGSENLIIDENNSLTQYPYSVIFNRAEQVQGQIAVDGPVSVTGGGPRIMLYYGGSSRGGFGAWSAMFGGTYNVIPTLSGYDGLDFATHNVLAGSVDTSGNWTMVGGVTAPSFSGALTGAVGATTPSTGAFTTVSASGAATANGGLTTTALTATGAITGPRVIASGTPPTLSGTCSAGTQVGGNTAGSFKFSAACTAGTVVLTFASAAPTGWSCYAKDMASQAAFSPTAYTTTTATITGTANSNDQMVFMCMGF